MSNPPKNWRDVTALMHKKTAQHEVGGQKLEFYAISPLLMSEIALMGEPIADAVAALLADRKNDSGTKVDDMIDEREGITKNTIETQEVSPELARYRLDLRRRRIAHPRQAPARVHFDCSGAGLSAAAHNAACRQDRGKLVCRP